MSRFMLAAIVSAALVGASQVLAADITTTSPQTATQDEIASAIDVAFGVAVTSRYVSRGVDLSDGPALQSYVELSYDWLYAGVWGSTVGGPISDPDNVEIDLYAGVRHTFGDLTLDAGYVHYFYDRTGSCCGEAYAKAGYAITEELNAGGEIYYDFRNETTYGVLNASYALPYDFSVSGGFGTWFNGDHDWNAGLSYTHAETLTVDFRYHDSNHSPSRFVVSLSVDSSLSALRGL